MLVLARAWRWRAEEKTHTLTHSHTHTHTHTGGETLSESTYRRGGELNWIEEALKGGWADETLVQWSHRILKLGILHSPGVACDAILKRLPGV